MTPDAQVAMEKAVAPHPIVWSKSRGKSNLDAGARDPAALTADILYGQPDPADVRESTRLKWVQISSAGYTRYDNPAFLDDLKNRGIPFCNASTLYAEPCAQHALAMLLALARSLPQAVREQEKPRWHYLPLRAEAFVLAKMTILLVGYGAIARRLAELLAPFDVKVVGFRRSPGGNEPIETRPIDQLDAALPTADVVINILPLSDATHGFFDAARFEFAKRGLVYISIGRGGTTDTDALINALKAGRLRHAYLDVTDPEPLPPTHPLWSAPNCHITPHTAGGSGDEVQRQIDHFAANLSRFDSGEKLLDRVV